MMPSLFVAHGAPLLALENNEYTRYLKQVADELPRPKAIVLFSAHWESLTQKVSDVETFDTIYDFGGFPQELFEMKYPAKGEPTLTKEIIDRFQQHGISYEVDPKRGLDHGAWVVLKLMYPEVDIPVISMSVNPHLDPRSQYEIGQSLAELREKDVLIVGSGGTVHNLGVVNMGQDDGVVDTWAVQFDQWLEEKLLKWDLDALFAYREQAPSAQMAVPSFGVEHFVPIFYAMGAASDEQKASLLHRSFRYRNLSHSVWRFG
ncbi:DODA-type extradiol aromatic ring-opening family dioxygenase [Desertibacillus haloalkaliphilus]|uniref:DODA-type extradiol aromatic ring-opening family dioxygenase n=1 Tax=Desertibacillus haloalkaliphilus TaxID=1328930 RepID=UPI001C27C9E8|nr:class III extradiol ring-cleavage dioxygenase [Desertibacillus haloalkaliphilus]MBU8906609.1 dioxygenase [Desertibacillus haloalkaliphilus]